MAASGWQNLHRGGASKIKGRSLILRTYIIPREQQADQPSIWLVQIRGKLVAQGLHYHTEYT